METKHSRKVVIAEKSLEGATKEDICPFVERCNDEKCEFYHPEWAEAMCINFMLGKCKKRNCK